MPRNATNEETNQWVRHRSASSALGQNVREFKHSQAAQGNRASHVQALASAALQSVMADMATAPQLPHAHFACHQQQDLCEGFCRESKWQDPCHRLPDFS